MGTFSKEIYFEYSSIYGSTTHLSFFQSRSFKSKKMWDEYGIFVYSAVIVHSDKCVVHLLQLIYNV